MKPLLIDFEDFINQQYCSAWVATAIVGSAVIGAATTAYTASKAADTQSAAAQNATNAQLKIAADTNKITQDQYNQTRQDLEPYRTAGSANLEELQKRLPFLTSPIVMDQATLEKTPGYDFTKTQGLKAVQNSAAARGLGVSGAALKGAATFTTGLANQTYKDQFALENTNRQNAYDRLMGLVGTGEGAAAQTGVLGAQAVKTQADVNKAAAGQVGSNIIGAGNAQAGALTATGQAFSNAANNIGGYAAYKGLYGNIKAPEAQFITGAAGDQPVLTY